VKANDYIFCVLMLAIFAATIVLMPHMFKWLGLNSNM